MYAWGRGAVCWNGARVGDRSSVPEAGFPLEVVRSWQLKNVSLMTRVRTLFDLPVGVVRGVWGDFRRFGHWGWWWGWGGMLVGRGCWRR